MNKDTIFKIIPIIISSIALAISFSSYQSLKKEKEPDLKIIQNLWTSKPRYELINESSSKLDETPSPSYIMLVPSKLYYHFGNGETASNLILTPIPYSIVEEQIVGNQTKESIVTTYLPKNFYGKKGIKDIISGDIIYEDEDSLKLSVATYPFMVIVSDVDYKYNNKDKNKIILSTPLANKELEREQYNNIMEYISDNADYLKLDIDKEKSIYETVQNKVESQIYTMMEKNNSSKKDQKLIQIIGGKEDGYGNVLKDINSLITPLDPIEEYQSNK
ncbi:hypothetical protein QUW13_11070 [Enterococcus hirae]|nr:hypothetical protein [Enterococcus hirae]